MLHPQPRSKRCSLAEVHVKLAKGGHAAGPIVAVKLTKFKAVEQIQDLVEAAPKAVLEGASKEDAEAAKAKLEEAGASVDVA